MEEEKTQDSDLARFLKVKNLLRIGKPPLKHHFWLLFWMFLYKGVVWGSKSQNSCVHDKVWKQNIVTLVKGVWQFLIGVIKYFVGNKHSIYIYIYKDSKLLLLVCDQNQGPISVLVSEPRPAHRGQKFPFNLFSKTFLK